MRHALPDPLYYLTNFRTVLDWVARRYGDLLEPAEHHFIATFADLPQCAQGLLVRMVMRKGDLFRVSKLRYVEIGPAELALAQLVTAGWVETEPVLNLTDLFRLLTKAEIAEAFAGELVDARARKADQLQTLSALFPGAKKLKEWCPQWSDPVCRLGIAPLCTLFQLLFFGNLRQDWSEFVLADLGIFRYENIAIADDARAFRSRADVDFYLQLHAIREQIGQDGLTDERIGAVLAMHSDNPWLGQRRDRLLFHIAQQQEKDKDFTAALNLYQQCNYPGARVRRVRVMEILGDCAAALMLAEQCLAIPESDAELQQLARMLPRLRRQLGLPRYAQPEYSGAPAERYLQLPPAQASVELAVRDYLVQADAPVHYVENTLVSSLFGLLCWPAIFAPLPGAFFHPFQTGPADLLAADFYPRRRDQFEACLSQLESGAYCDSIWHYFRTRQGIQSPFVVWPMLTEELLTQALSCIPAHHLGLYFRRILADIRVNRSGLPDLIQFWPSARCYRLIEVKGPGDRLQDNQKRWLAYCQTHAIPVEVCYVSWLEQAQEQNT